MAGIGSLLKGTTKGAKAIQEATEASKLAPPRLIATSSLETLSITKML